MRKNGFYTPLQAFDSLTLSETLPLLRIVRLRQYDAEAEASHPSHATG